VGGLMGNNTDFNRV